jgi:hypothetical protein
MIFSVGSRQVKKLLRGLTSVSSPQLSSNHHSRLVNCAYIPLYKRHLQLISLKSARIFCHIMERNSSAAQAAASANETATDKDASDNAGNCNKDTGDTNSGRDNDSKNDKRKRQSKWKAWGKNKKKKEPWYRNRGEKIKIESASADEGGKKEQSSNSRRQEDWASKSQKTIPHEGSFAHHDMQKLFHVQVDVSTKGDGDDEDETTAAVKVPKRKLGILVSFLGSNYGGFQINAEQRTLQAELELALFRSGIISPSNFGFPSKYSWSNSARTDKGVHAAAQVVSLKGEMIFHSDNGDKSVEDQLDAMREKVNEYLPSDVRVLDIERVTRPFCARTNRDKVRYQVRPAEARVISLQ